MHLDEDSPIGYYKAYYNPFILLLPICESAINKESRFVDIVSYNF